MSLTLLFLLMLLLLLFGGLLLAVIAYFSQPKYGKARLLTPSELDFYFVLAHTAYPEYQVFAQVRLANVVYLKNKIFLWEHFNPLGAKCVDFVLFDTQTGETALVVELDDKSHQRPKRRKRDKFVNTVLKKAGIPIFHQKCQVSYDSKELKKKINKLINPPF